MTTHQPVVDRWLRSAAQAADAPACQDDDRVVTHGELLETARRRAQLLRESGLPPEGRVGLMLASGVDQATWVAAVMLAGGCAVPIGLNQPEQRLRDLVALACPAAVVVDATTRQLAGDHVTHDAADPGLPATEPFPAVSDGQAAYICFTSGTTGAPKGVVVTHGVIAHTTGKMAAYLGLGGRPRTHVLTVSWSFDVAMMDLWLVLTTGGTLVMPRRENLLGPALITTLSGLTKPMVHGVPSLFGAFTEGDAEKLPDGTTVMLGGESVPATLLRRLSERTNMHVVYGITETGVITTTHRVTPQSTPEVIGRPLDGADCLVIGEDGVPVPDGEPGELWIGGPVVARGYLNAPELTAKRFVIDSAGVRRYRTGDLVRRRPDGILTFHGRIDQQLKIRGHRVEPAETEQALLSVPGIRQVVVVAAEHPAGEVTLVGYVAGDDLDTDAIRRDLAARLPAWLCPAAVEVVDSMPTSVTGKIDRARLPAPRWPGSTGTGDTEALSATERAIGGMWRQLLSAQEVQAEDNFVALGGHSLNAAQLSTALRDQLGVSITVLDVLETGSLRELSRLVDSAVTKATDPSEGASPAPLTPSQRQIWLQQELAGTAAIYNLVVRVDLHGPLRVTALQRALHAVERGHCALRTSIVFDGNDLVAVERPAASRPLALRTGGLAEAIRLACERAIDVSSQPPWNYRLFAEDDQNHVLLLTFHHVAVDGVALYQLLTRIGEEYSALVDPSARIPAAPVQRNRALGGVTAAGHLGFWKSMMFSVPPPARLPGQHLTGELDDFAGWARPLRLAGPATDELRRAASACGATLHALTLSCFVRALARTLDTTDVLIGVLISRRGFDVDVDAVGQFVTVLPVRFRLPEGLDPVVCLDAVAEQVRQVQRHSGADPAEILEVVRGAQGVAGRPFDVVFAWEDETPRPRFAGLTASWSLQFTGWSEWDLTVELADQGDMVAGQAVGRRATSADVDVDELMRGVSACATELIAELRTEVGR